MPSGCFNHFNMKTFYAKLLNIILISIILIGITSCCPKITEKTQTRETVTSDTDTVYIDVPIYITEKVSDTIEINLLSFCDSLYKGFLRPSNRPSNRPGKGSPVASLVIDSNYIATIFCKQDAYRDTIRKQSSLIVNLQKYIETYQTKTIYPKWYDLFKYGFFILLGLHLLVVFIKRN
jgi:hypothetical protein